MGHFPMNGIASHVRGEDENPCDANGVNHEKDFTSVAAPSATVTWGLHQSRIFAMTETTDEQLRRIQRERDTDPGKTGRTMRRGQLLARFAREGRLRGIDQIVSRCPREEMLAWFVVRMFKGACLHNRTPTIVYMVDRGLDVEFHPVLEALHWVVEGCDEEQDGIDVVPTLNFLVTVAGMRPDQQRRSDFHTPLHVAIQRGLFEAARRLIELGADINAVAKEDAMPLTLAEQPVAQDESYAPAATPGTGEGCGGGPVGETSTSPPPLPPPTTTTGAMKALPNQSFQVIHTSGGGEVIEKSEREGRDQEKAFVSGEAGKTREEGGGDVGGLAPQPSSSSSTMDSRRRMRVAASRARICGLLVERGARRTWRRGRSEAQVALDEKYRLLLLEGDGGRNLSTFNG